MKDQQVEVYINAPVIGEQQKCILPHTVVSQVGLVVAFMCTDKVRGIEFSV